jgi:hypothetical protein
VLAHEEAISASDNPDFKVPDRYRQLAPFLDTFMALVSELESSFIAFGRAYACTTSQLDILARFAGDAATEDVSEIYARAISVIQLSTLDSTHDVIPRSIQLRNIGCPTSTRRRATTLCELVTNCSWSQKVVRSHKLLRHDHAERDRGGKDVDFSLQNPGVS